MAARIIDGKAVAADVRAEVAERVRALVEGGHTPGLAAVLVGDDPASHVYVSAKQKDCAEVGIASQRIELPADASQETLLAEIARLNADPAVTGMIVQLPVPDHIDELAVQMAIDPLKDVDGLHPANVGLMVRGEASFLAATPFGIAEVLYRSGIGTNGAEVVIVGRGGLVGMPLSIMLAQKSSRGNATVTLCHTGTVDLAAHTTRADILVVAAGRIATVTGEMVKPGATVIDVGTNRGPDGKLVGDVAFDEVAEVAGAITPVPGGVGPMTRAMLLVNTVAAAERAARSA
ncbi:MAG TPA: bifunctional 5,10-methylenetetrahydrofolate dehydrogenase/5,10-methenyltetrahydrofolate cyclohydrolase [Actinomycetota bacterium]|nr:bifunctional 5,10-methylenetetrahydrofolate dehydrogenase/5,10-methenyltetrahydrofolate cyclohydrolase [Actinomycetota bacterium]